jgi:hypothetical protein
MLFKFLGNSDAPDWILSEINTLSFVSSVRIKFILQQVLNLMTHSEVDFPFILKHLEDAKLSESQTKSVLAVLSFVVQSAVRYDTEPEDFAQELQQLGTPMSHASTIIRFYREHRRSLRKYFRATIQRLSESAVVEYRSDIVLKSKLGDNFPQGRVLLRFSPKNQELISLSLTGQQAEDLSRELKVAIELMQSFK